MKTIGERLDLAMKEAKFPSQSALARASGVPQPTINRILKGGGKKGPEAETVKKLAAARNVSFDWLNEGIGESLRVVRQAHPHDSVAPSPEEIIELITAYKNAEPKDRHVILDLAKVAARSTLRHTPAKNYS